MLNLRGKAKELHVLASMNWHRVADTGRHNTLQVGSPCSPSVAVVRGVILCGSWLVVVVSQHVRPLLARLIVVLRVESGINSAVVDLHLRPCTCVAGIHSVNDLTPACWSVDSLTLSAGTVPGIDLVGGRDEASCWDAVVDDTRLEDIGVRRGHDVRHHGSRTAAGDEHFARVGIVLGNSPFSHVGDAVAVAAAVVRECGFAGYVPAGTAVRAGGVDYDETISLGELGVRRASVVGLGRSYIDVSICR